MDDGQVAMVLFAADVDARPFSVYPQAHAVRALGRTGDGLDSTWVRSAAQLGDEPGEGLTAVARDLEERVDDLADAVGDAERVAAGQGCTRLFLITANDNVDALRFYQRRGFRLVALHPGAVDDSRVSLKPEIPLIGSHGIPLRDELELGATSSPT